MVNIVKLCYVFAFICHFVSTVQADATDTVTISLTKYKPSPYEPAEGTTDPLILFIAGLSYEQGIGTDKNLVVARKWYSQSSNGNFAPATRKLASMILNGEGGYQDPVEAISLFKKAANFGDTSSQNTLGYLYANGIGTKKDMYVAFNWFRIAAKSGSPLGEYNLAICYIKGIGVTQDVKKGGLYARKALKHGVLEAKDLLVEHQQN